MKVRTLAVEGALEFSPEVFRDERGSSSQVFNDEAFEEATGRPLFPVRQVLHSRSNRGVVRGIHFTATPPGSQKYVFSLGGAALDIIIDLRVGSPTYGAWDSVRLDRVDCRALYFPVGVGHAFIPLEDDTLMCYLLSNPYVADLEMAIWPLDPALGLPVPGDREPVLSERDRVAPTLAEAAAAGMLPDYEECRRIAGRMAARQRREGGR